MNKNIKKLISFTIIFTAFSMFTPSTINILKQSAYAYSNYEINALSISSGYSIIPIYDSITYNKDYKIKNGDKIPTIIYSKISSDKTSFKLNTIETSAADIRVFSGNEKLNDIYGEINIPEGESKSIYIRLYNSKNASDNDYDSEYELIVERESSDSTDNNLDNQSEDDTITLKDYDDIYLDNLVLFDNNNNKIDFDFVKTNPISNINVDENTSSITVKAIPEEQVYNLLINDKHIKTTGDDKDERLISLDEGKNIIKIRIVDSFNHKRREYFLVVTRGQDNSKNSNNNNNNNSVNTNLENTQGNYIKTNGNWQYKKADGTIAVGWTCINNEWYYFDSTGAMKTGWLQDTSGKWYYLKDSGAMAKNTVIDGYTIVSDGSAINK